MCQVLWHLRLDSGCVTVSSREDFPLFSPSSPPLSIHRHILPCISLFYSPSPLAPLPPPLPFSHFLFSKGCKKRKWTKRSCIHHQKLSFFVVWKIKGWHPWTTACILIYVYASLQRSETWDVETLPLLSWLLKIACYWDQNNTSPMTLVSSSSLLPVL